MRPTLRKHFIGSVIVGANYKLFDQLHYTNEGKATYSVFRENKTFPNEIYEKENAKAPIF